MMTRWIFTLLILTSLPINADVSHDPHSIATSKTIMSASPAGPSERTRSKESTFASGDSPGLADHDDELQEIQAAHSFIMGEEPVRTRSSAMAMVSNVNEHGVQVDEGEEKGHGGLGLSVKKKVLHFTVSLLQCHPAYILTAFNSGRSAAELVRSDHGYWCDSDLARAAGPDLGDIFTHFPILCPVAGSCIPYSGHCHLSWVSDDTFHLKRLSMLILLYSLLLFLSFAVVFSAALIARYCMFPQVLPLTLKHSQKSMFFGCYPMGLITIVSNICTLGTTSFGLGIWPTYVAVGIWFFCVILSTIVAIGIPWSIVTYQKEHRFEATTAALLLPVVPPITAAATGSALTEHLLAKHPTFAFVIWNISFMQLGIGLPLALMVRWRMRV